jgi:hypothetical protein
MTIREFGNWIALEQSPLLKRASELLASVVAEVTQASAQVIMPLLRPDAQLLRESIASKDRARVPDHPAAVGPAQRSRHRFPDRHRIVVGRFSHAHQRRSGYLFRN